MDKFLGVLLVLAIVGVLGWLAFGPDILETRNEDPLGPAAGVRLRVDVVDKDGKPISGASVSLAAPLEMGEGEEAEGDTEYVVVAQDDTGALGRVHLNTRVAREKLQLYVHCDGYVGRRFPSEQLWALAKRDGEWLTVSVTLLKDEAKKTEDG